MLANGEAVKAQFFGEHRSVDDIVQSSAGLCFSPDSGSGRWVISVISRNFMPWPRLSSRPASSIIFAH